jgi:hypothetical protein
MRTLYVTTNDYGFESPFTLNDDESGSPIDLTNATGISAYMRAKGGTSVLTTITVTIVAATLGQVKITWPQAALQNRDPGWYELEVEIALTGGGRVTVFDLVPVYVRDEVGP